MVLINSRVDIAFDSKRFHHAYIWKNDIADSTSLKIILNDGQEVWWDSSPGLCEPARQEMIQSLKNLVLQLDRVWTCYDGKTAFNIDSFSYATIDADKEGFMWYIIIHLDDSTELRWDGIDMTQSEDTLKPSLANLVKGLNNA